jgi:hypothetical protein
MLRYWNDGNREIFIYLLHLMERRRLMIEKVDEFDEDKDDDEARDYVEARNFVEDMETFRDSFRLRVPKCWKRLSSPYLKGSQEEIAEFIAEDDEVEEDEIPHHLIARVVHGEDIPDPSPEDEIVAALKQKRAWKLESEESEEGSDSDDGDQELEGSDDPGEIYRGFYSEESEPDEWEKSILDKRKPRYKQSPKSKKRSQVATASLEKTRLGKAKVSESATVAATPAASTRKVTPATSSQKKRKVILEDSEGE